MADGSGDTPAPATTAIDSRSAPASTGAPTAGRRGGGPGRRKRANKTLAPGDVAAAVDKQRAAGKPSLKLRGRFLGPAGAEALAAALAPPLAFSQLVLDGSGLGERGVAALGQTAFAGITKLNLADNQLGDGGAKVLATALAVFCGEGGVSSLVELHLAKNDIGEAGMGALAAALSSSCPVLESLNLRGNRLGDGGARHLLTGLAENSCLRLLSVAHNGIGAELCRQLLGAFALVGELNVSGNPGAPDEAEMLRFTTAAAVAATRSALEATDGTAHTLVLRALGFRGDEGIVALAELLASCECKLRGLDLRGTNAGADGAKALASVAPRLPCLTVVRMDASLAKTPEGRHLAGVAAVHELERLAAAKDRGAGTCFKSISDRGLGDEGATVVADSLSRTPIVELGVHYNDIGSQGCGALARAMESNSCITDLSLSSNLKCASWGSDFAIALASNTTLRRLDLGGAGIGDVGAAALANVLQEANTTLTELHLDHCDIRAAGVACIRDAIVKRTHLASVWLHGNPGYDDVEASRVDKALHSNRDHWIRAYPPAPRLAGTVWASMLERGLAAHTAMIEAWDAPNSGLSVSQQTRNVYATHCASYAQSWRGGQTVMASIAVARCTRAEQHAHDPDCCSDPIVLALGVGTKFLSGAVACSPEGCRGRLVRDSHAEVLARRAFRRMLHGQVARSLEGQPSALLDRCDIGSEETGTVQLRLKHGLQLHMYSSLAPCGGATLGGSRLVKPEAGRKMKYSDACGAQDIRLSCTDKIVRWQILGLQGGGLSGIIRDPLCVSSLTIGRHYYSDRCDEALLKPIRAFRKRAVSTDEDAWPGVVPIVLQEEEGNTAPEVTGARRATTLVVKGSGSGRHNGGDGDECIAWHLGDVDTDNGIHRNDGRTGRPMFTAAEEPFRLGLCSKLSSVEINAEIALFLGQDKLSSTWKSSAAAPAWAKAREVLYSTPTKSHDT